MHSYRLDGLASLLLSGVQGLPRSPIPLNHNMNPLIVKVYSLIKGYWALWVGVVQGVLLMTGRLRVDEVVNDENIPVVLMGAFISTRPSKCNSNKNRNSNCKSNSNNNNCNSNNKNTTTTTTTTTTTKA